MPTVRTDLAGAEPAAQLLDRIAGRLRGPAALRRDLLAELRDGVDDAVTAHLDRGLPADEAERAAVADFGDPDVVRAECQRELTAVQARRTAVTLCVTLPVVELLWTWWYPALAGVNHQLSHDAAGPFAVLPLVEAVVAWTAAGAALHQAYLLARGRGVAASAVVAALAVAAVVLIGGSSVLMMSFDGGRTLRVLAASPRGWLLAVVSGVMLTVLSLMAWRTTSLTRLARVRS
jgi:hypothetical protein